MGKNVKEISEMVKTIFLNHSWSGNVRELKNVIESIFNFIETTTITMRDIPAYLYQEIEIPTNKDLLLKRYEEYEEGEIIMEKSLTEKIEIYEKSLIEQSLKYTKSIADAARMLKITPQSLQYKLKKYSIE